MSRETLKKFIEYLKKIYVEDYIDKAKLGNRNLAINNNEDFWYFTGQCTAINRLINLLDKDLENFMKEDHNEN